MRGTNMMRLLEQRRVELRKLHTDQPDIEWVCRLREVNLLIKRLKEHDRRVEAAYKVMDAHLRTLPIVAPVKDIGRELHELAQLLTDMDVVDLQVETNLSDPSLNLKTTPVAICEKPPRWKSWVGLTNEQIVDLVIKNAGFPTKLAEAIEAKLKEKNT